MEAKYQLPGDAWKIENNLYGIYESKRLHIAVASSMEDMESVAMDQSNSTSNRICTAVERCVQEELYNMIVPLETIDICHTMLHYWYAKIKRKIRFHIFQSCGAIRYIKDDITLLQLFKLSLDTFATHNKTKVNILFHN